MRITFLGKNTRNNGSPTLYVSDHGTYIIQGWKVPGHPDLIEIPHPLLAYLVPGTCLGVRLHDTGHGTFTLSGSVVTDLEALALMNTPSFEMSVEVPIAQEIRPDAIAAR